MGKRPDSVYQENARRGAITRQCPKCQRKAAISKMIWGDMTTVYTRRHCRWCDFDQTIELDVKTHTSKVVE